MITVINALDKIDNWHLWVYCLCKYVISKG